MKRYFKKQSINVFKVLLSGLIVIIIFFFSGVFNDADKSWVDYIEIKTFIAIVLFFVLDTLSYLLISVISKMFEDSHKLTKDYSKLIKKVYPLEKCYQFKNQDNTSTIFPSVVYEQFQLNPKVKIEKDNRVLFEIPEFCKKNYDDLLLAHRFSKIHNTLLFRLDDIRFDNKTVFFTTSRTTSYDVLVTNRSMDYQVNEISTRDMYETGPFLNTLNNSKMANHLGYSLIAITSDGYVLLFYKKKNSETYKRTLGPTMTNTISAVNKDNQISIEMMEKSIANDLKRRLNIDHVIDVKFEDHLIGISRSLVEGGAPMLTLCVQIDQALNELTQIKDTNKTKIKTKILKRKLLAVKKEIIINSHTDIERIYMSSKVHKSSPSTLLCLAIVIDYLKGISSKSSEIK